MAGRVRLHLRALAAGPLLGAVFLLAAVAAVAAAGPPFPEPVDGQRIYDTARVFSTATIANAAGAIAHIEEQTGAQVVVYTQVKPGATEESVKVDGAALGNQWGVGRKGFDDGLVLIFDFDSTKRHGKVAFVAGPGFRAVYLDDAALQAVIDDTMLPYLRDGAFDRGLLAGLEKIVEATSPEAAAKLQAARQINSLVGLVVGPLLMILLAGLAFARWFRAGRDPVYLDSTSIYLPAPPDGLTAATGALLLDGRCSRRALTTALLDLASRDEIAIYRQDKAFAADPIGIQIRTPAVDDSRVRLNRRSPLGPAEAAVLSSLGRNASRNEANALVVEGKDLLTFGTSVAAFESALEDHAVAGRLFTAKPATVVARWTGIAVAEFVLAVVAVIGGASLPSSGLVLLGAWLAIAAVVTGLFARHQPARTKDGAMLRAMLLAYRRTLQASLRDARSMEQVLAEPRLAWLQTPDRAVVWSTALDLGDEVQEVLDRTAALFVSGEARPGSLYAPWWYHSYGRGSVPGSAGFAPGLMSSSAVPDLSGMFAALGTIGNTPSSSGSSGGMGGGGGFSGGASGSF